MDWKALMPVVYSMAVPACCVLRIPRRRNSRLEQLNRRANFQDTANERNFGEQFKNAGFVQLRSNSRRAYNIRTKLA